jgi:hypothetical protein
MQQGAFRQHGKMHFIFKRLHHIPRISSNLQCLVHGMVASILHQNEMATDFYHKRSLLDFQATAGGNNKALDCVVQLKFNT